MSELLEKIALCVQRGKVNKDSPYPPDMKGEDGADELTAQALESGANPNDILQQGLMAGMTVVGKKFSANEMFVPDLLMAAKAMTSGMVHLKASFESGAATHKGTFIVGTVQGDLHDIGKNLVRMMMEGNGWEVVDLGVDAPGEKFLEAAKEHPGSVVGMSALLTTTMVNMEGAVKLIKDALPDTLVVVGGAPLTQEFCDKIGADGYEPDPQGISEHLDATMAN